MTPEEEFEQGQREGRERARKKSFHRFTAGGAATIVFFGIFIPLVSLEDSVITAVPVLGGLGRLLLLVLVSIAAAAAAVVWRFAGGNQLKAIEAWERERDDL